MEDDLVAEWRSPLPLEPIPIHLGHIAHLYLAIYDLLRVVLAKIRDNDSEVLPKVIYQKLERSYSSLILWSRAHGVAQGELDDLLKRSKELRQVTITFLINTGSILAERIVPPCLSNNHVWDVSRQTRRVIRARDEAVQSLGNYAITGGSVTQSRPPSGSFDNAVSNLKTMIQGLVDLGPILTDPLQDDQDTSSEKSLELNLTADYSAIVGSTSRRLSKLVYATPQQEQKASTDAPRNSSVVKLPVMEATVKHEDSKENEPISWDDPHN